MILCLERIQFLLKAKGSGCLIIRAFGHTRPVRVGHKQEVVYEKDNLSISLPYSTLCRQFVSFFSDNMFCALYITLMH